jgi:hypothetical protein
MMLVSTWEGTMSDAALRRMSFCTYLSTISGYARGAVDDGEALAIHAVSAAYNGDKAVSMNRRGTESKESKSRKEAEHLAIVMTLDCLDSRRCFGGLSRMNEEMDE